MTFRDRVAAHRHRLRDRGLRPIQVWVPDVRSTRFAREAARQARAVAKADMQASDQEFVEAVTAPWDD